MSGSIGILNVGAGDTKLVFDKNNPAERIRAARIVKDMLRRGYALLIEVKSKGKTEYRRALDFDENTCEYIIADFDPVEAAKADAEEEKERGQSIAAEENDSQSARPPGPKLKRGRKARVSADSANGVAVARSAGG